MEVKRFDNFHVHFILDEVWKCSVKFTVYPVVDWTGPDNTSGTSYETEESGATEFLDAFDEKRAKSRFTGNVTWRGCWDERIYFVDDEEYWGDELAEMSALYSTHILPHAKAEIKKICEYEIHEN